MMFVELMNGEISKKKANSDLRNEFKDFKKEMDNLGIISEMRVMVDNKLASTIHAFHLLFLNYPFLF